MAAELNEEQRTIAKGTIWGLLGNVGLKLASLIYLIIIARFISQDDVGTFYLALSVLSIIAVFSDLGISAAFNRYIPYFLGRGEADKTYGLLRAAYTFSGSLSILIALVLFLGAGLVSDVFRNPAIATPIEFLSIYLVFKTFFSLNNSFLLGRKKIKESNILQNTQNVLKLLLTLAFLWLIGEGMNALVLPFLASYLLALVASFWYVRREIALLGLKRVKISLAEQFALLREIIPFGLTLSLVMTFWSLIMYTDRLMIGYFLPPEVSASSVAVYTIATSLATLIALFGSAIGGIFLPLLSELHGKEQKEKMLEISATALRWSLFIMVPFVFVMIVFPDNILQMFYGSAYVSGAVVLAIFTAGVFVRMLSLVQNYILAALRLVRIELYVAGAAALANVGLNWLLIPLYGIEGAALASALSFCVVTGLFTYYSKKVFGFGFPKDAYKPLLAGLIGLAVIFALKGWVVELINAVPAFSWFEGIEGLIIQKLIKLAILGALFGISCVVYFVALIVLKAFKEEDLALVKAGLRKIGTPTEAVLIAQRLMGGRE